MTLLRRDEVPIDYQDKLILSAYRRPGLTALESVCSVFQLHNETFNFWTHFLVFGYFVWKFLTLGAPFLEDQYYWPLLCVGFGACMYPLLSCLAHAFSSMDVKTRNFVFYLDYMGISIYSCTSSITFLAYTSPVQNSNLTLGYFFAYTSAVLAILSMIASCKSRHQHAHGKAHLLRLSAYSIPFIFTFSFTCFWLFYYQSSPIHHHYSHLLWNPVIGLVIASRLPERYIPLHFDVVGHSHQIFHVVVFIATNYQIDALIQDCFFKKDTIHTSFVSQLSVQVTAFVLIADTIIVLYYAVKLYWPKLSAKKN